MDSSSPTEIAFAKQMSVRGLATQPVANTVETQQDSQQTPEQEMQTLKEIIVAWREIQNDVTTLNSQIREKKKKQKTLEEIILRIMKKNNIGALDLKGSGGRLLYRRQTTKGTLNVKTLTEMLTTHLKSESAATDALKFINEHRGAKIKESLMYEKE
jgi:Family of unknown function (DUF5760)